MDRASLESLSAFLVELLAGLQATLTACAEQKKQCPLTCSQRKGFIEAANAIISVAEQIIEEKDDHRGNGASSSSLSSSALADHVDTSSIAVLSRQIQQVRADGNLLTQFIVRYNPNTQLEPGTSPTITTSRVADLLKVKQTFRSLEINLHDVEQLLRIVYSRVFETPTSSPSIGSITPRHTSSHVSERTEEPHEGGVASRYMFPASEDDGEGEYGRGASTTGTTTCAPTRATTDVFTPSAAGSTSMPTGGVLSAVLPTTTYVDVVADAAAAPQGRRTQKMSSSPDRPRGTSSTGRDAAEYTSPTTNIYAHDEEDDEPDARPVEETLSGSCPPPERTSVSTLPYVRGSRSQVMPSASLTRSEMDVSGEDDGVNGSGSGGTDGSGPRTLSHPRYAHPYDDDEEEDAGWAGKRWASQGGGEDGLSSIKPRATAVLFPSAHASRGGAMGTPPLHPSGASPSSTSAPPQPQDTNSSPQDAAVTAPPSLQSKRGRLVVTQHSHRMPGELWGALCDEIADEVEACFVEDVLNALNGVSDAAAPRANQPVVLDGQIRDVRLSSLQQFLYIRFAVEHDRYDYPKKDIDARVAACGYPMMSQLYEEAFHAQRAREEAELDRFDSAEDDVFLDVVSSSQSRRGSSSQRRRDSVCSVNSAAASGDDAFPAEEPNGGGRSDVEGEADTNPLHLAVPTRGNDTSVSHDDAVSVPSTSQTLSSSALPASGVDAGVSHGTFPTVDTSAGSVGSSDTAGAYRIKLPGKHWPTVLFFVSKPMVRPVVVEEVALATGVALKAVTSVTLTVGSLVANFQLDASAAADTEGATSAPAAWPSCSEFVIRALECHNFALIREQYAAACRDLFLEDDLADQAELFAEDVLGPNDIRDSSREGSHTLQPHAATATSGPNSRRGSSITATAAPEQGPVSYFTLPTVEELDKSLPSLPRSHRRPSASGLDPKAANRALEEEEEAEAAVTNSQTHRLGVRSGAHRESIPASSVYASSVGGRPDTPDNEPVTLLHVALENDTSVAQLRLQNPHLARFADDEPLPEDVEAIHVPRPAWLYEEAFAEESIASGRGTPLWPSGSAHTPPAQASEPAPTPPLSLVHSGMPASSTSRRSSTQGGTAAATTPLAAPRQDSPSSVASSTVSQPESATARLRKRQKLHYIDPSDTPLPSDVMKAPITAIRPAPVQATEQADHDAKAGAEDVSPTSSQIRHPVPRHSSSSTAPAVIAQVVSAYPHLTTPAATTPTAARVTVGDNGKEKEREEKEKEDANQSKRPSSAAGPPVETHTEQVPASTASPQPASAASTAGARRLATPRSALPPPQVRPRTAAGVETSTAATSAATATATASGGQSKPSALPLAVPQRAHPNSPPPPARVVSASAAVPATTPTATLSPAAAITSGQNSARTRHGHRVPATPPPPPLPLASQTPQHNVPLSSNATTTALAVAPTANAIPPSVASVVVPADGRPRLGFRLDKNLIVLALHPNSAAAESGMSIGAQLRTVNGKPLRSAEEFQKLLLNAAAQPLPSVLLITTARPTSAAQGAAWADAEEDAGAPSVTRTAATGAREVRTHWIRLLPHTGNDGEDGGQRNAENKPSDEATADTQGRSPRGRRAEPPSSRLSAPSPTSRAAGYQRVRSHSANPLPAGTTTASLEISAAADSAAAPPPPRRSTHQRARAPRASSGAGQRRVAGSSHRTPSAARRRHDSFDDAELPAPRRAVPLPIPMAAAGASAGQDGGAGAKITVRSRSAQKGSREAP